MARKDFGMDIEELRAKYKLGDEVNAGARGKGKERDEYRVDGDANGEVEELEYTQARGKLSKRTLSDFGAPCSRTSAASTKIYALRSSLPVNLLAAMSNPQSLPRNEDEDALEGDTPDEGDSGALLRLEKGDGTASGNIGLMGIRSIIMCIILAYGRVIMDGELCFLQTTALMAFLFAGFNVLCSDITPMQIISTHFFVD